MTRARPVFLSALGIVSALGRGKAAVRDALMAGARPGVRQRTDLLVDGAPIHVAEVTGPLPPSPAVAAPFASRNLSLSLAAAEEISGDIERAVARYGAERVAVVLGATTSGIAEGEVALAAARRTGRLPDGFDVRVQELGSVSEALAVCLGLGGPAFTISTACSSGTQALIASRALLESGIADAVVTGGVDSLCRLTVNGFRALSALSSGICNPFSRNRDGTMIGEGAALFLMERQEAAVAFLGAGSSTDAFSMTAPEPEGTGVEAAIRAALKDAGVESDAIDYVQLHGTGTRHNDIMESKVIERVFGRALPCSSSKGQIGHTLGAAGAMAVAHCWLAAVSTGPACRLPPHLWDGEAEDGLLSESLVPVGATLASSAAGIFLSNAIAFGGNNATVIVGRS